MFWRYGDTDIPHVTGISLRKGRNVRMSPTGVSSIKITRIGAIGVSRLIVGEAAILSATGCGGVANCSERGCGEAQIVRGESMSVSCEMGLEKSTSPLGPSDESVKTTLLFPIGEYPGGVSSSIFNRCNGPIGE